MNILVILTSHDQLGDTGLKTGFWLEELAAPYYVLLDSGASLTLASPAGGKPPLDPKSELPDFKTRATERFDHDSTAQAALAQTKKLSEINLSDFDAIFFPGGHGPLWDLASDLNSIRLIEMCHALGKPVAAVCHGPAVLLWTKDSDGLPLVRGKRVTGFSNSEEAAVELSTVVPFSVEEELGKLGGFYEKAE